MGQATERPSVRTHLRHAGLLCMNAGFVDAFAYGDLGHVFTANMTGNTVFLGMSLASKDWPRAETSAVAIGAFCAGAAIASLLRHWSGRSFPWLILAAMLLLPVDLAGLPGWFELALVALAMGVQGASLSQFGPARLQTVVVTGTLLRLADAALMAEIGGFGHRERDGVATLAAGSWACYAIGAGLGTLLPSRTYPPLLCATVLLLLIAGDLAIVERRQRDAE